MNLIHKYIKDVKEELPENITTITNFRRKQYDKICFFLETAINFLEKISNGYIKLKNIKIISNPKYVGVNGYITNKIIINIEDPDDRIKEKPFLIFNFPDLVHDSLFYLSGSYYSPAIYILDKPIIYKANSIKLYGLLNSVTIFFKVGQGRAIFCRKNIPIQYFLQWFIKDAQLLSELEERFKLGKTKFEEKELITYFSGLFSCGETVDDINNAFNLLFFDDYTKQLYDKCYNSNALNFSELVNYSIKNFMDGKEVHFVDLSEKRVIFIEQLLSPIFRRISEVSFNIFKGYKMSAISFHENDAIKFFMNDLAHPYFYDLVNFYSGILTHKASFMNPNSTTAPPEIKAVHSSHFRKICPITTPANKPGESVSIIPNTKLDEFGLFI